MQTRILILFLFLASPLFARFYIGIEGGYIGNFGVFDIYQDNLKPLDLKKEKLNEGGIIGNIVLGTEHFFLNNYLGIRWGVFAGYGKSWGRNGTYGNLSTSVLTAGLNTDVIINFIAKENLMIGFILGIGYSYNTFKPNKNLEYGEYFSATLPIYAPNKPLIPVTVLKDESDCFVNNQAPQYWTTNLRVGASILLNKHHRIEAFVKIPLDTLTRNNDFNFYYWNPLWNPPEQKYDTKVSYTHSSIQALLSYKYVF
ncbi:outer membrane protein [Helicobacter cholecystus]|uniref:outer membrane beta-barrel protein n=1 Tax=Helicobacter cholecystus TaxID=45498 RepID=UPI000CF0F2DA|nr:outer membrane beta-barrel protein [Helicobacter cholecystus]VEJ24739.1 outer membrane protein [Helicobacter cholecystus]